MVNLDTEPGPASLKTVAEALGISHVSVSRALRGAEGVSTALRARVVAEADRQGYRPNPFATGLIHLRKRVSRGINVATLTGHWAAKRDPLQTHTQYRELRNGVVAQAELSNFNLDHFWYYEPESSPKRLHQMLQARGIEGLILIGVAHDDEIQLPLEFYAIVHAGRPPQPGGRFSHVFVSWYQIITMALDKAWDKGLRRPLLLAERFYDNQIRHELSAAFIAYASVRFGPKAARLFFIPGEKERDQQLRKVIEEFGPDVIFTHSSKTAPLLPKLFPDWKKRWTVIETGVHLPVLFQGMVVPPSEMGAAAVNLLAEHLLYGNRGIPTHSKGIFLPPSWIQKESF